MTPWTLTCQAPLSMGFFRQEYWSGLLFTSQKDLPDPGIEPRSPALQADSLLFEPSGKSRESLTTSNHNRNPSRVDSYLRPISCVINIKELIQGKINQTVSVIRKLSCCSYLLISVLSPEHIQKNIMFHITIFPVFEDICDVPKFSLLNLIFLNISNISHYPSHCCSDHCI